MRGLAFVWTFLVLGWGQDERLAVPDPEAQKQAEKVVREVFGADYGKTTPSDRMALARKLLKQATETQDDPAGQFVMWREVRDLAAGAGDPGTSLQAIEEMGKRFSIDSLAMKLSTLTTLVQEGRATDGLKAVAEACLKMAQEAGAAGDFETSDKAAALAVTAAKKAKDVPLVSRAEAKAKEAADFKAKAARLAKAREALAANPSDPAANLELGQFEGLLKGNWEGALSHLAKGADAGLRTLAERDLAGATDLQGRIALGDAWWDRSEKEAGAARQNLRGRAAHWYSQALDGASGITRVRIEKRLAELGHKALPLGKEPALVGWWRMDEAVGKGVEDSSGRGHRGTFEDGIEWTEGKVGKALKFTGATAQVRVADSEALRITGDLTLALWFRPDSDPLEWARLAGKGDYASRNYGLWLEKQPGRRILFQQYGGANRDFNLYSRTGCEPGAWTHVAGVVQGETVTLYINGKKDGAMVRTVKPLTSADPFTLAYSGLHQAFSGALDDVRLYSRALNQDEIQKLAAAK